MKEKSNSTKRSMKITTNYPVENEPVDKNSFAKLIREKRRDLKEDSGKVISTKALGDMLDISYEMFRKILNQEKPTLKCIFKFCFQYI